ncbi:MAG: lactate utilization protein [Hyphomicrobiales bacterium]|nr:lactate utilization protein [Hyphomicrobiales bacterium]MBV8826361.1 lactate utilization protein [Hyphomicrobiales bacterium]MBV9427557.1 lactate utilization protein [Bradyrhizobiaceae bacterium]
MSARDLIFGSIRRSLGVSGKEAPRRKTVGDRLAQHPAGLVPARGQLAAKERLALFRTMVEAASGSIDEIADVADVPSAIAAFLRAHNLPMAVRRGGDPRLAALPWERERTLEVSVGRSDGKDVVAVSHAFGAVAESGTLMLVSGPDNPTTLNFLPDTHVVVLDAKDVAGDYETLWQRLREKFGDRLMPRTVNLITGPSRSADIEQTLILGAHGPRRLHVMVVGKSE